MPPAERAFRSGPVSRADGEVPKKAFNLIEDGQGLYDRGQDGSRRMMNQSFFERIYVNDNGSVATNLASRFDGFHAARTVSEAPAPS